MQRSDGGYANFSKIIKQFFILFSASASVAFFGFLINVVITKTSMPVVYGEYRFALNFFYISVLVFQFGYTNTASNLIARTIGDEQRDLVSSIVFVSLVLGVAACFFQVLIFSALGVYSNNDLYWKILVFSPYVLFYLVQLVVFSILIGQNKIKTLSNLMATPHIVYLLFLVVYTRLYPVDSFMPLLAGYCLINVVVTAFSVWICRPKLRGLLSKVPEINKANFDFGMKVYFGGLVGVGSMYSVGLFSTASIGIEEYAFFALGFSFVAPFQMISSVMGSVMYRMNAEVKKISAKMFALVFFAAFFSVLVFSVFIDLAFPYVFSEEYIKALPYVKLLAVYGAVLGGGDFINKFLCSQACGNQVMRISIIGGVVLLLAAVFLVPLFGTAGLLSAYIFSSIVYLFMMATAYLMFVRNVI